MTFDRVSQSHSKVQMESRFAGICVEDPRSQKRDLGHPSSYPGGSRPHSSGLGSRLADGPQSTLGSGGRLVRALFATGMLYDARNEDTDR